MNTNVISYGIHLNVSILFIILNNISILGENKCLVPPEGGLLHLPPKLRKKSPKPILGNNIF